MTHYDTKEKRLERCSTTRSGSFLIQFNEKTLDIYINNVHQYLKESNNKIRQLVNKNFILKLFLALLSVCLILVSVFSFYFLFL